MQRLFSTFPNSWPGAGLLLLRVIAGVPVIEIGIEALFSRPDPATSWIQIVAMTGGGLLVLGLWTPIGGGLQALAQGWLVIRSGAPTVDSLVVATVGFSLAMLGPGAWSIDARLYGRKRIDVQSK